MNAKMKISILCGVQLLIASINSDHEGVHDCNYIFDPYLIVPDTWSFGHDGYTNTVEWFFYWNEYPMNACWRGNGWDFPSTLSLRFQCVSEEDGGTETLVPKLMIFQNSTDCSGSEEATQIESWNVDIHHELSSTHFECDKERDCAYTQIVAYDSDTPSGPLPPGMYDMDSNPYYLEIDYPSDWDGWYNFGYDEECEHVGETFDTRFAISEGCTKVNYGYDEWYIITCSEERGIVEQTYSDHKCEGSPDWKYEWQKSGCHWGYLYEIDCGSAPIPIESVTGWDETHWTYDDYSYDPNSNYNHDDGMHLGGPDYAGSDSSEDWMHPQWSCSYIVNPRFESSSLNIWSEEDLYLYEAEWPIGACIPGNGLNVPREHSAMFQCANGGVSVRFIVYPNAECAEDKDIKIETVTGSATFQCNATPCSFVQMDIRPPADEVHPSCDNLMPMSFTNFLITEECMDLGFFSMELACEDGGMLAINTYFGSECEGVVQPMGDMEDMPKSGCQDDGTLMVMQCGVANQDFIDGPLLEIKYTSGGRHLVQSVRAIIVGIIFISLY